MYTHILLVMGDVERVNQVISEVLGIKEILLDHTLFDFMGQSCHLYFSEYSDKCSPRLRRFPCSFKPLSKNFFSYPALLFISVLVLNAGCNVTMPIIEQTYAQDVTTFSDSLNNVNDIT